MGSFAASDGEEGEATLERRGTNPREVRGFDSSEAVVTWPIKIRAAFGTSLWTGLFQQHPGPVLVRVVDFKR